MARRIAIVRLSAIGDVIHGLPLAASLRRLHPEAEITWIVQRGPAPLLRGHPWIDRVLLFPRRDGPVAIARFLARLPREGFDLAVDLMGNMKAAMVLAATRAEVRAGLAPDQYRELPGRLAANRFAPEPSGPHSIDRTLSLCRLLGDPTPEVEYGLFPTAEELERSREELALRGPTVAISVGAEDDVREWTDAKYIETAKAIAAAGRSVIVLAGPDHTERGERIAGGAGVAARAGETDLRGLLADLTLLAGTSGSTLLACDSAPIHLAVAVGLRVVALSGPQDPARTGPYGHAGSVIHRQDELPCAPCLKRTCDWEEERACMRGITVERVLAVVRRGEG